MLQKMKQLRNSWYPHLRQLPIKAGILTGHSEYTKFIVLGRSRVGSNLLRGLLNSHSQIETFGEIFRDVTALDWDHMGYFQSPQTVVALQKTPAAFIDTLLFGKFPRYVKAVGFKIFYYHAENGNVWDYLTEQKDLRVIHLKRKNILRTHLSRQKAAITDEWINTSQTTERPTTFRLNYEACLDDFCQTRAWERVCDDRFRHHPVLEIFYENLASDRERDLNRIQEFLGVDYEPVQPTTYRQSQKSLTAVIENYAELKKKFNGTPWAAFFEE